MNRNYYLPGVITILLYFLSYSNSLAQSFDKKTEEVKGLEVGAVVNNFSFKNIESNTSTVGEYLKKGPVVLIFYRGQWCPVCNKYLSRFEDSLEMIVNKGATVIAVSPEIPEKMKVTQSKTNAKFILASDTGYMIAKQFDVLFKPSKSTRILYNTALGAELDKAHGNEEELLPVPATFIIDQNSKIIWKQFDHNYNNRASIKDILKNLP